MDENFTGGFGEWLLYQTMGMTEPGPLTDMNQESYYYGRMVGDALSMAIGAGGTAVGIIEIIGAIGGGAGITLASGGTAAGAGLTLSVSGATAGATLAVSGSAATGNALSSFYANQNSYREIRANRMNAESGAGGMGSTGKTGRTIPNNLNEQLAMKQVQSDPLNGATKIPIELKDSRWPTNEGWVKMQNVVKTTEGNVTIHFNYNTNTGAMADFKFK
jgi:hypothetical protein